MTTQTPIATTPKPAPKPAKLPVKPVASPPAPPPAARLASPAEQLAELATLRAQILEQITDTEAAPRPLAEAGPDLSKLVHEAASRANSYASGIAQRGDGWIDSLRALDPPHIPAQQYQEHAQPGAFPLLAAIVPEQVKAWLTRQLESSYRHLPPPLSIAQRTQRLTLLQAQLAEVEGEMANVFWAAEAQGIVPPPPEIAAAALLGLSK